MTSPIDDVLPYDADLPDETQPAWHAVVHLIVPCLDKNGTSVESEAAASDYISETLRGEFLDWGYVADDANDLQTPIPIIVSKPYVEGTWEGKDGES